MNTSEAVESAMLGSLIMSEHLKSSMKEVAEIIPPICLSPFARPIWEALAAISERDERGDLVTLAAELTARGIFEQVGGVEAIASLVESCPNTFGYAQYARDLARLQSKDRAQRIAKDIYDRISKGEELNGELDELAKILATRKEIIEPEIALINASELEAKNLGPIDWVLYPLASKEALTLIHGNPKGGKSVFALYCALSIAKGFWASELFNIDKSRNVLYIAYEDNLRRIKKRLIDYNTPLVAGGLPGNLYFYTLPPNLALQDPQSVAKLLRTIRKYEIESLFIDTFSYAHTASENDASEMQPVMASCRRLCFEAKLSTILLHHSRKSSAQGDESAMISKVRGSSVIGAAPDHVLLWGKRVQENVTHCEFESKDVNKEEWHVHYIEQENGIAWRVSPASQNEIVAEKRAIILVFVREYCLTHPEGVNRATVTDATKVASLNIVGHHLAAMCYDGGPLIRHKSGSNATWMYHPSGLHDPTTV